MKDDVEAAEVWGVSCSLSVSELLCPDFESLLELSMLLASQTAFANCTVVTRTHAQLHAQRGAHALEFPG